MRALFLFPPASCVIVLRMSVLPAISLNTGWVCEYFQMHAGLREAVDDVAVPSLVEWVFDRRQGEDRAAWLRRGFDLAPLDICVSYVLRLDSAPEETQIYINGERVGQADGGPCEIDVTAYVALEYNEIALRVEWNAAGRFEGVRLQPVPCD